MKFTVNRLLMYQAVKTVLKAVRPSREIPEIGGILIEADALRGVLTLTGTDVRTYIQRRLRQEHIEESGSIILTPVLADMLRLLAGEDVVFESGAGNTVLLSSDKCRYSVPFLKDEKFPKMLIPFPEDTIQIKGINSLIRRTVFAADSDNTDYSKAALSYVKLSFHGGMTTAQATDGRCMAITASPHCADGNLELILHEKALTILDGIVKPDEELYVGVVGKFAVFMKEDMFFSTMLFTGDYLEAGKVLENFHQAYAATVDAKQLYELVSTLSAIFGADDDKCVDLRIEADRVCVQVKTALSASSSHIPAAAVTPTPAEGFHYQARLLINCLRHLAGPVQIRIDQRGFVLMEANGSRYFISPRGPVRIAKKEDKQEKKTQKVPKAKTTAAKAA